MSWGPAHAICLGACGALFASAPAAAAPKPISGTLSAPGYTVIALADNGKGKTSKASRRFSVRPPAERVTLQLRRRDGVYFGPIVVSTSRKGKRAILGVKAGAKLGRIKIDARKGYATVTRMPKKQIDTRHWALAKKGVPIGADKFGLVRSKVARSKSPPGDLDADGVPNPLDIDDNGNLVIDKYERQGGARTAGAPATAAAVSTYVALVLAVNGDGSVRVRTCGPQLVFEGNSTWPAGSPTPIVGKAYEARVDVRGPGDFTVVSIRGPIANGCPARPASVFVPRITAALSLTLEDTVNANAAALTVADINDTLSRRGFLWIHSGSEPDATVELDCGGAPDPGNPTGWRGGLSYCTRGGTGRMTHTPYHPPRSWELAFPGCCDSDGDGFGKLGGGSSFLSPGATTGQIGTGDVLNWRVTQDGVESQFPRTLSDVFATVPALVSYTDGAGNSGTLSYPVPPPFVGSAPDFLGDNEAHRTYPFQGFPVAPCPVGAPPPCVPGDVVVTFRFWRPQREAIAGVEQGQWTDIGGLVYSALAWQQAFGGPGQPFPTQDNKCAQSQLSTTDPSLTPEPESGVFGSGGFRDAAHDRPADPANTLSFSMNLTNCYHGSGKDISVWLVAGLGKEADANSSASQQLLFTIK